MGGEEDERRGGWEEEVRMGGEDGCWRGGKTKRGTQRREVRRALGAAKGKTRGSEGLAQQV